MVDFIDKSDTILLNDKPFSLLYEEIVIRGKLFRGKKEEDIKRHIATQISNLNPNNVYRKVMESGFEHILTTNYDYTLENSLYHSFHNSSDFN